MQQDDAGNVLDANRKQDRLLAGKFGILPAFHYVH
jgi:hypothetical protein